MYSIRETFEFQTEINISYTFIHSLCCFFFSSSPWGVLIFSHESSVLFVSEESVWSEITNPFMDSPKKRTLCWGYIYMTQWPNDVMIRHGATCMAAIFDLAYWIAISESCAEMHRLDNQNETSAFKTARTGIVCKKVNNYDNLHGTFFWNFQRCSSITFYAAYTRWRGSISNHIYYKIICLPDRNT